MCCVCVRVWVRVQVCGCVCVCTCASLPRTLEPSTLNVPRARGPCQPRHPAAEQPEGQGPTPSVHLPIQPILCNKRQQLTELRMTPALLLRHRPSPPCLPLLVPGPGSRNTGHSPSSGCGMQLCPLKSCLPCQESHKVKSLCQQLSPCSSSSQEEAGCRLTMSLWL